MELNIATRTVTRVRDYMTSNPQTLGSEHSLLDAVLIMRREGFRHIPILEDGRLVGVLSERDVARAAPSLLLPLLPDDYNRLFEDTLVGRVMSKSPISTTPETPLVEAVELVRSQRLGCLPVLGGGTLVGIITVSDMLRALGDLMNGAMRESSPVAEGQKEEG